MTDDLIDRRAFLARLSGLGGGVLTGPLGWGQAPRVVATPTVFFAQPDGRNTLVRFLVEGTDAPAGRMRVFDRARRQLGTAGVIGTGGRLYGELWIPLGRELEITSELELPGTRGPIRTTHRLVPRRRWTVYWVTAAEALARHPEPEFLDHADFLHLGGGGRAEPGSFVVDADGLLDRVVTAPLLLAGSGFQWIGVRNTAPSLARVGSRDGSAVIAVATTITGSPADLGLDAGRNEMTRRVENWLEGPGAQLADDQNAIALVVGAETREALAERVAEWNSRFVHPRLVTDRPNELFGIIERRAPPISAARRTDAQVENRRWQPGQFDAARRAERWFDPLTTRLSATATGLAALAEQFGFRVPGTLVINPTPFGMTGVAAMPDGTERLVTDVPALGYVCVPYPGHAERAEAAPAQAAGGRWTPVPGSDNDLTLDSRHFELRVALETGAIRSLVTRANGRQWVRRSGALNTAAGFRLETVLKLQNPGVGTRVLITRRSPEGTALTSAVTTYDALPWVDVVNQVSPAPAGSTPVTYGFAFELERPTVSWEVPAGFDEQASPVGRLVHLRWLRLATGSDAVLFRGLDAPVASVREDAEIVSVAPAGQARYRLAFASGFSAPQDAWAFGWSAEPLIGIPVPGTGRATLPSFGSLLVTDQAGICIVELRSEGNDILVYLQELVGVARDITVGPGVLRFRGARRVDFGGRDLGALPMLGGGGTAAPIRAHGITAVRLTGVELAGG